MCGNKIPELIFLALCLWATVEEMRGASFVRVRRLIHGAASAYQLHRGVLISPVQKYIKCSRLLFEPELTFIRVKYVHSFRAEQT